jgi:transposase
MKGFTLTAEELQELRVAHREAVKSKDARSAYKINAVILLGTNWSTEEVAEALLLDDETLRNYMKKYQEAGFKGLIETFHLGGFSKLSAEQISQLCVELDKNIYTSTKDICTYVQAQFGHSYTASGMTDLLHRLEYVYKKPKLVPVPLNVEAQEQFLKQFNDFMENKRKNEAVIFVDAIHPVHNTIASYGWIRKGCQKALESNSGRQRLNIHGAMNAQTFETTIIASEDSVNSESTILLFEQLEHLYPLAAFIYVILDNAKYHFSRTVQAWLKNSKIKLVFLPTYSPELNLIERLWKVFKKQVMYNKYYKTFEAFKAACFDFFKNQQDYFDEIESIMGNGLAELA